METQIRNDAAIINLATKSVFNPAVASEPKSRATAVLMSSDPIGWLETALRMGTDIASRMRIPDGRVKMATAFSHIKEIWRRKAQPWAPNRATRIRTGDRCYPHARSLDVPFVEFGSDLSK